MTAMRKFVSSMRTFFDAGALLDPVRSPFAVM